VLAHRPAGELNAKGVGWLDWPCGQNPGRKPEGRQRASTREARSLGEQDSTVGPAPLGVGEGPGGELNALARAVLVLRDPAPLEPMERQAASLDALSGTS